MKLTDITKSFNAVSKDVAEICESFFQKYGVNYFNYGRFYDNGDCYLISSSSGVNEFLYDNQHQLTTPIPKKFIKDKFHYLIPYNGPYQHVLYEAIERFNLANPIDLIERYDGYYDMFCFMGAAGNDEIINFYLNNIDILENFTQYFKDKGANLINIASQESIVIPSHMRTNFKGLDRKEILNQKTFLNKHGQFVMLSNRELDCIHYLTQGCSAKETARKLDISHRTVETHFEKIKNKLGCHRKKEILSLVKANALAKKNFRRY